MSILISKFVIGFLGDSVYSAAQRIGGSGGTGETLSHYRITSGNVLRSRAAEPLPVLSW